jgi:hypothetical protein
MTTSFLPSTDALPLVEPAASKTIAPFVQPAGGTDLRRVFATVAAVLAAAGGAIHLGVIGDHTEYRVVAAGFAVMGVSQCVVALWLFRRPSRGAFLLGAGLHAAIGATWALSRTFGLWFVPGQAEAAEIGVADVVANIFSIGVIGVAVIVSALDRSAKPTVVPRTVARRVAGTVVVSALLLTAIAVSAPHVHDTHGPVVVDVPVIGQNHDHGGGFGAHEHR